MGVQFASLRWAQTQHALLYGPSMTLKDGFWKGGAKGLFSWRATEQEMTKIRSGVTVGGRIQRMAPLGRGGRTVGQMYGSWAASPFAFSKWSTAAQLMHKPGAYTRQAGRMHASNGFIEGTRAARAESAGILGSTKRGVQKFESMSPARTGVGGRVAADAFDDVADIDYARQWTSQALRFGTSNLSKNAQLGRIANRGLNIGTGMMFDMGAEAPLGPFKAPYDKLGYKSYSGSSKVLSKLSAVEGKGAMIRYLGEESKFVLSGLGKAVSGLSKFGGTALMAVSIFDTARLLGEGAYNLGEMAFYSPAKRGYQDMSRFATRGMFGQIGPQGWLQSPTAATNRARAVQAIQGSKMNARSALGNEASLLAGHFG